ncbi:MAG: leucine-rich repeat domain-containing protein [Clostridia bacterium]|nr:leucine-rich repeat domain-containing protein [Clostridia bacterium]
MKRFLKSTLSIFLVAVMVLGTTPLLGLIGLDLSIIGDLVTTKAEATSYNGTCGDNLTWSFDEATGTLIISGSGDMEDWSYYDDTPWYDLRSNIKTVTIGNGVTSIAFASFYGYENLTDVYMPNSILTIDGYAFGHCTSLSSVTIPENVKNIGYHSFGGCTKLERVRIPKSVETMGINPFVQCAQLTYIEVDKDSSKFFNDSQGVLYSKENNELISYPAGRENVNFVIPENVTSIGVWAFGYCSALEKVLIGSKVTNIGNNAFTNCNNLISVVIPDSVTTISTAAFANCVNLEYVHIPSSVKSIGDYLLEGSSAYICNITEACYAKTYCNENQNDFRVCLGHETPGLPDIPSVGNEYNLGEETYSFSNFGDSDSFGGHCFGMSMTSSAYYIGELDTNNVGLSNAQYINGLSLTDAVREPICKYQAIQGSYSANATVAGGSFYLMSRYDINSDWNEVVNFVKNHDYDNKGFLQIGFRKNGEGGHAINFLRYEEVNGQPRIYAYDNNFPTAETYFYKDTNGKIMQAPYSTFSGSIDCIALRDVSTYFSKADNFDTTRYIYADRNEIAVNGVSVYPLDGDIIKGERVVFEIPANVEQVTITPLVNNAEFTYINEEYTFGNVDDDTVGIFKLATTDDNSSQKPGMTIVNKDDITDVVIKTPSTTTISYGDSIILHTELTQTLPVGWKIKWTVSNGNFSITVSGDASACTLTPAKSGDTTVTVILYDAEGNEVSKDEQTLTSKAGFFDKIIAFFKKLFGATKVYDQY